MSGRRLRTLAVAVLVAAGLLVATRQIGLARWYAPYGGYRAQVDAFLAGRLALTEAPDALAHDLAWTEHGVQQVWGLGVPAWQAPFELVGRAIGVSPFPDRVPMLAWLALMMFVVLRAFGRRDHEPWFVGAGSVVITGLLPAFVTLLRGRLGIYEEAAVYAYGASTMLLGGLALFARRPTARGYVVLVAAAGLGGFIRPTVWFYGLATLVVATAAWLRHRDAPARPRGGRHRSRIGAIILGGALFVAGGGLLYATNARRFGSGAEFGHRLNLHSLPGNITATRFSYPFEREPLLDASVELFGSLFGRPELDSKRGFYQAAMHHGQQGTPRWREYYFTTFSWAYVPILVAGLVLAGLAWRRRREPAGDPDARWLGPWAVNAVVPLLVFYLWSPSVSSRYQLDLAPALAALIVIAWRAFALHARGSIAVAVLAIAWLAAVITSKPARGYTGSDRVDREAAARAAYKLSRPSVTERPIPAGYDLADPEIATQSDVVPAFARCFDRFEAPIDCDVPALPGDLAVAGTRDVAGWRVVRSRIPDDEPARCAVAEPVCRPVPSVAADPLAMIESIRDTPPPYYLNGFGWDLATGRVPPATYFFVTDPRYVEVDVEYAPVTRDRDYIVPAEAELDWARSVQVAIGLVHLAPVALASTPRGVRIRFEARAPLPRGLHVAFVAFGPDHDLDQQQSDFVLRAIRWRTIAGARQN